MIKTHESESITVQATAGRFATGCGTGPIHYGADHVSDWNGTGRAVFADSRPNDLSTPVAFGHDQRLVAAARLSAVRRLAAHPALHDPADESGRVGLEDLAALQETDHLCPDSGIDFDAILGQHAHLFTQPFGFNADLSLQRLGDLAQHRTHFQVQGRALEGTQEPPRQREAERLFAADAHRPRLAGGGLRR